MKKSITHKPSCLPHKSSNSIIVDTHKMIKAINSNDPQFVVLKEAAIKYNCVLLLPPASLVKDLVITPNLLASHLILLDTSHKFITLSYVPGTVQDSIIRIYQPIPYSTFYPRLLEEAEQIIRNTSSNNCVLIESVDSLYCGEHHLTMLHISDVIVYQGCEWKWKQCSIYDNNEYQIELFFQQKIELLNKEITSMNMDIRQQTRNILNEEIVIFKIINLDNSLLKQIEAFVLKFPLIVKGISLEEREKIISQYCNEFCDKIRKDQMYCVMNNIRLKSVLKRMIITRLYPYLWQPSISVLEGTIINSTMMDLSIKEIMKLHNFVSLKQLGLSNKNIPSFSEIIEYIKEVDGLRCPNDKLQYLNGIILMVEQICKFLYTPNDVDTLLKFIIIKSQMPHFASTLRYIEVYSDKENKKFILNTYNKVLEFCSSLCQNSLLIDEQTYDEEIQRVSSVKEIKIDCGPLALTDVQILGLLDLTTTEQPIQLDAVLKKNPEDIRQEDIPILIHLLKQFNEENIELKKLIAANEQ
ncbi:hypothetical protein ENUP19_0139G0069 [Entamoeba nuttalli]|uniref:VPS9 domain-containing protein n=2 Tax=Entamoeba nuttalli TaxID=412467 RepID=K2H8I6_ENTNP|nr:hypothetical protein ENU1_151260 [Entamoeba nuttalli P19]EKE38839.1 hypothetical protein ENU1_151260 [Entamoeba nuttalli P19]|eukprot:XP_008858827.1 hypothetical protein ENU1_151260 [Entamoeba nuttalli P19]